VLASFNRRGQGLATDRTFDGRLIRRGDDDYDEARFGRVFNRRRPDRRPQAILLATSEDDIVAGVLLAIDEGWQVAVRAGGHSWPVWSVRDQTLLIDLGNFREMSYDPTTQIASATPSVKGGAELSPYLAEQGRFFPGGHCPTVGIGGFLLQGGQGWAARGLGWAAEWVEAIDVVTADGRLVRADAGQNSDLFWAARGAGPSFPGVVTRFHLRTMPHPGHLAESTQFYALDDFDDVITWLQRIHHTIDPRVEIVAISATPPTPIAGHDDIDGQVLVVNALAFVETADEAEAILAPLNACPYLDRALAHLPNVPVGFDDLRERQIAANPEGWRYRVDNAWITGDPSDVVPAIRRAYCELPTREAFTIWYSMAPLRELPDMAFSLQSEIYLATYVVYHDDDRDDDVRDWVNSVMAEMQPVTAGQYLGDSDLANRQVRFMSDEAFTRLQDVRRTWDPDDRFVTYLATNTSPLNQNHWDVA
jgi:FAD/FMN-containing dehydrogenase